MAKEKDTKTSITELIGEVRDYVQLQKKYVRYTLAEQLTLTLSKFVIVTVLSVMAFVIFIFAGLALVHFGAQLTGNIALCYAIYAFVLLLVLSVFYMNRRSWVILPIARFMTTLFVVDDDNEKSDNKEEE